MNKKKRHGTKRVLSLVLAVMLTMSGMVTPVQASDDAVYAGTKQTTEREKKSNFEITSAEQLPEEIKEGETYVLTKDIVLAEGQQIAALAGTLDGKGHVITLADKPLAKEVSGVIQNLGVTTAEGKEIVSSETFSSMAVTLTGTIQNCFSTAALKLEGFMGEVGGLVGTLTGGTIRNSYVAGDIDAMLSGGLVGINNSDQSVLANSSFVNGDGPVSIPSANPQITNTEKKTLAQFQSGAVNQILNTDLPDTGYYWVLPEAGNNNGLPVLEEGKPETGAVDKTVLKNLIAQAEALKEKEYTEDSWKTFEKALEEAKTILKKEDASQVEIDESVNALQQAMNQLAKEKPTAPVAPPEDESKIISITSQSDLEKIDVSDSKAYYVLKNDITLSDMYFPLGDFQGVFDGQGHTVTFEKTNMGLFNNIGESGVLQNLYFTGEMDGWDLVGPAATVVKGSIINCYSDVKGSNTCGFGKRLDGGVLSNSYSVSEGKKGAVFNNCTSGTILNSYWQEYLEIPENFPGEALVIDSGEKTEAELKTKEFVQLLNENRGTYGTKWGQGSDGYPYFGEDQEYIPDGSEKPDNKYQVTFTPNGSDEAVLVENGELNINPDMVNAFRIIGQLRLEGLPETSTVEWEGSNTKPDGVIALNMETGELFVYGEGTGTVTATEIKEDGTRETAAVINVTAKTKQAEEIRLFIGEDDVTNGTYTVAGSEWTDIRVKVRYKGESDYTDVSSSRFRYTVSDEDLIYNVTTSNSFYFKKPGTGTVTVTSADDETLFATVEVTSTFVPVESIEQSIPSTIEIHGRNANSDKGQAFNPGYYGITVTPENASNRDSYKVESSDETVGAYMASMINGYVPYKAGTTTYTASLTETNPETNETHTVTDEKEVTYTYLNPLKSVTSGMNYVYLKNGGETKLDLDFEGERSKEGYSVTEPELQWTYDKEGIVQIARKTEGGWKKDDADVEAPDYGYYLPNTDYYVYALEEGTVTATGTPVDQTNDVKPVQITITVTKGDGDSSELETTVKEKITDTKTFLNEKYKDGFRYNDEWGVFGLVRAGETLELDDYYQELVAKLQQWSSEKSSVKPTDLERVALTLSLMGKDITDIEGMDVAAMIYNHDGLQAGSNELAYALIALDARNTEIPDNALWSRSKIVAELLKFQNKNGGFGLTDNISTSVDATAYAVQALANYQEEAGVSDAIEKALSYFKEQMTGQYDFGSSESIVQVILALTALDKDPIGDGFGTASRNMITRLLEYEREDGGFAHDMESTKSNLMATNQALQALEAYRRYKAGENAYWDLTDVKTDTDEPSKPIEGYWGVKTEAKVYDDFENDIWLQYQQKEMKVGDTANLRPWRLEQIISDAITNDVQRPTFHFEIIAGDSISLDTESSTEKAVVTAKKPGTSVVKVTYDAMEYGGKTWGATSPVNTAYAVYTVGEEGTAVINCSEELQNWRHYDTIYYAEGETVPYTFQASADGAESLKVTLNGEEIQGTDGEYTANLENRSNIIGIQATDKDGNVKSLYRVIDARFIEINVQNKENPEESLKAGDTANISFRGVTMPVYKLATIYNPVWTSDGMWGKSDATYLSYKNETLGEFKGQCEQWDLATNNDFDVTFEKAGSYTFESEEGIFCEWWGSPLGSDITANGSGEPNLNAPVMKDWFSKLPSFTVDVKEAEDQEVAVEKVNLDKEALELKAGESGVLTATVTPENATDKTVTWSSDNEAVATVDANGKVTAVSEGTATVTAKAGEKTATCKVTVKKQEGEPEEPEKPEGTVTVSIQDMIPTPEGEDWPAARGTILDKTNVEIQKGDTVVDVIERACNENDLEIDITGREDSRYIKSIAGLGEFDRGAGSGWMGTLNGWFTDKGLGAFEVQSGDVITVEYTLDRGSDLTDTKDKTGEAKSLGHSAGRLSPEYKRDVYEYDLILSEGTEEVSFTPDMVNRYNKVKISADGKDYRYGAKIPVQEGTEIRITSTGAAAVSLSDVLNKATGATYVLTVKYEKDEPEQPDQEVEKVIELIDAIGEVTLERKEAIETAREAYNALSDKQKEKVTNYDKLVKAEKKLEELEKPEEPEKPEQETVTITNEEFGISLTGKGITADMELEVSKLTKDSEAVDALRKEIPSTKGIFALYNVKLMKNGKEIDLSEKAELRLPVGEKYNGKTMKVLLHRNGKVEELAGTVSDGFIAIPVTKLGDFGVVVDISDSGSNPNGGNVSTGGDNGGGSSAGGNGTVKTGDQTETQYWVYLLAACAATIAGVTFLKRRFKQRNL